MHMSRVANMLHLISHYIMHTVYCLILYRAPSISCVFMFVNVSVEWNKSDVK